MEDVRDLRRLRQEAALHGGVGRVRRAWLGKAASLGIDARGRAAPGGLCGEVLHPALLASCRGGDNLVGSARRAVAGAPSGLLRKDLSPKPAYERLLRLVR